MNRELPTHVRFFHSFGGIFQRSFDGAVSLRILKVILEHSFRTL